MRKVQPLRSPRQTELICKSPANAASRMHLAGEMGRGERGKSTDKAMTGEKAPTRQREKAPSYYIPSPMDEWVGSERWAVLLRSYRAGL